LTNPAIDPRMRTWEEPLDLTVFLAVLAAALMHASWNAVVRVGLDRFNSILLLSMTQSALALALLPFVPVPAAASWPWVAAAGVLHTGYKLFLIRAYQHGDLSQIYPLARGAAPPIVAVGGVILLGERLPPTGWAAVALIAVGVALMALRGGTGVGRLSGQALGYALATAGFVASYTLVDGQGARLAGSATGFAMWMFVGDGLVMLTYAVATRGGEGAAGGDLGLAHGAACGSPFAGLVLDRALGVHPGSGGPGGGAARNQRALRHADRRGGAEGTGRPLALGRGAGHRRGGDGHAAVSGH